MSDVEDATRPAKGEFDQRGQNRRRAFLDAARQVFLEQGYDIASVNDVVGVAGGSLATLYAQFGNKEGLFLAVVQDHYERLHAAILPIHVAHRSLEQDLQTIGEHIVRALVQSDNLAFLRLVVGHGRKFPDKIQRYIAVGGDKILASVAEHLATHCSAIDDPDASAGFFIDLLRGGPRERALADNRYVACDADISSFVRNAVRIYLYGALARTGGHNQTA